MKTKYLDFLKEGIDSQSNDKEITSYSNSVDFSTLTTKNYPNLEVINFFDNSHSELPSFVEFTKLKSITIYGNLKKYHNYQIALKKLV